MLQRITERKNRNNELKAVYEQLLEERAMAKSESILTTTVWGCIKPTNDVRVWARKLLENYVVQGLIVVAILGSCVTLLLENTVHTNNCFNVACK